MTFLQNFDASQRQWWGEMEPGLRGRGELGRMTLQLAGSGGVKAWPPPTQPPSSQLEEKWWWVVGTLQINEGGNRPQVPLLCISKHFVGSS